MGLGGSIKRANLARKFDLFIFDWDGTLSSLKLLRALNERLNPKWVYKKSHALDQTVKPKYNSKEIRSRTSHARFLAPLVDVSMMLMKPRLFNGSVEVLSELKKRKKQVALFTNGAKYRILPELEHLRIEKYFDIIVSAQDIKALKPNPLGIDIIIKELGCDRNKTVSVGDMVNDIIMAKYARVSSCALACGFDSYSKLKSRKPDYIFRSMEELEKAL